MKFTRSRVLAWARYWRFDMWWWGIPLLLAIGVQECTAHQNQVYIPAPTVNT